MEVIDPPPEHGLCVKLALDDRGSVGGMFRYGPIENVPVLGADLYYLYCIWVRGCRQGRGNFQKRGMGTALLQAAEAEARERGAKGFVARGLALPFFMRASLVPARETRARYASPRRAAARRTRSAAA